MSTLGWILLGCVLGILLVPIGLWIVLKLSVSWIARRVGPAIQAALSVVGVPPPLRIQLKRASSDEWTRDPEHLPRIEFLRSQGFEPTGCYDIEGVGSVAGYCHPGLGVLATVVQAPASLDLTREYADGSATTVSDLATGQNLPRPPLLPLLRLPGAVPAELMSRLLAERSDAEVRSLTAERYTERYADLWARSMDWLAERGGYTIEELRGNPQPGLENKSEDEALRNLRDAYATGCLGYWWKLQSDAPIPYDLVKDKLLILFDDLDNEKLEELVGPYLEGEEGEESEKFTGPGTARERFVRFNQGLKKPFRKVWEKSTPLSADFYLPPSSD